MLFTITQVAYTIYVDMYIHIPTAKCMAILFENLPQCNKKLLIFYLKGTSNNMDTKVTK